MGALTDLSQTGWWFPDRVSTNRVTSSVKMCDTVFFTMGRYLSLIFEYVGKKCIVNVQILSIKNLTRFSTKKVCLDIERGLEIHEVASRCVTRFSSTWTSISPWFLSMLGRNALLTCKFCNKTIWCVLVSIRIGNVVHLTHRSTSAKWIPDEQ